MDMLLQKIKVGQYPRMPSPHTSNGTGVVFLPDAQVSVRVNHEMEPVVEIRDGDANDLSLLDPRLLPLLSFYLHR
jgi:hypothetical protein